MRGRARAFITIAAIAFVACGAFGEGKEEQATPPNDGGPSLDAPASESASPDALPFDGPAPTPFCSTLSVKPPVCLDFEDGKVPTAAPWERKELGGAKIELVESGCSSSTSLRCIESSGSALVNGPPTGAGLRRAIGGLPRPIVMGGTFRVVSIANGVFDAFSIVMTDATGAVWVLEVEIDGNGKVWLAEYQFDGGSVELVSDREPSSINLTIGTWHRLELVLTVNIASVAILRIDGAEAARQDVSIPSWPFPHVDFGDVAADQGLMWNVQMDDLTAVYNP